MSSMRSFKQKLALVFRLWEANDYDTALDTVEGLLASWPGNAHLHTLWASIVQLQETPAHSLEEVKSSLQQAIELDKSSPAAAIELGHFLDAVENNPQAALKVYADGIAQARQLLIEGLIGQTKAFLQLARRDDARKCLLEVLNLTGHGFGFQPTGPFGPQIEQLLGEVFDNRSAS